MTLVPFVTNLFFDRKAIKSLFDDATLKGMSRGLAFIRRRARSSLRRRKAVSKPGQTPSVHSVHPFATLKNILFVFNPQTQSGIVGPVGFGKAEAPKLSEFGGQATRRVFAKRTGRRATPEQARSFRRKLQDGSIVRAMIPTVQKQVTYPPRPFMGPALTLELPRIPEGWAAGVRNG